MDDMEAEGLKSYSGFLCWAAWLQKPGFCHGSTLFLVTRQPLSALLWCPSCTAVSLCSQEGRAEAL